MSDHFGNVQLVFDAAFRLSLLRLLEGAPGAAANSSVLHTAAEGLGHAVTREKVEAELIHLDSLGAVTVSQLLPTVMVARLTSRGEDHIKRRIVLPGVAQPRLG